MSRGVSTRIESSVYDLLLVKAEEKNKNISTLLRELIESDLQGKPPKAVMQVYALIVKEMREVRKDIAVATEVILVSVGEVPKETARSWVENNLYRGN